MKEIIYMGPGGCAWRIMCKICLLNNQGIRNKTLPEEHACSLQGTVWLASPTQSSNPASRLSHEVMYI